MSTRWRKVRAMFVLTFLLKGGLNQMYIALPIPAGWLCFIRCVFQLVAKVAVT